MSAAETFRAFPSSAIDDVHGGMSLLDWFAGQALAGLAACPTIREGMKNADYARVSYAIADAMIAERAKSNPAPSPDELLIEARRVAATHFYRGVEQAVMEGGYDGGDVVPTTLAAIQRGIEIAKGGAA